MPGGTCIQRWLQWHNRSGQSAPPPLLTGKFLLTYLEKRGKEKTEKGENGEGKKENCKRVGGKLKMEGGKSCKMRRGLFFFCFVFVFVCLFFTFQNDWNLFWVYQHGNFLPGKSISPREKKSGKMTLPPQKNFPVTPLGGCDAHSKKKEKKKRKNGFLFGVSNVRDVLA